MKGENFHRVPVFEENFHKNSADNFAESFFFTKTWFETLITGVFCATAYVDFSSQVLEDN